jgi:5-methylcytosine-specific restriction endonuclease McrA
MVEFKYDVKPFQVRSYKGLIFQDKEHITRFKQAFGQYIGKNIWLRYQNKVVKSKISEKNKRISISNGDLFGKNSPFSAGEIIILLLDNSNPLKPTIVIERELQVVNIEAKQLGIILDTVPSYTDEDFSNLLEKVKKAGKTYLAERLIRDHRITNGLKKLYNFKCQICGNDFKEKFGISYAEPHHIIPFSQVKEDDPKNIVVVCPNHHRMIEITKAEFDYENKKFTYSNGLEESLVLNKHL